MDYWHRIQSVFQWALCAVLNKYWLVKSEKKKKKAGEYT